MGSIFQSFHQSKQRLPVSQRPADSISKHTGTTSINNNANHHDKDNNNSEEQGGIRKRLSSLSLKIQLQPANMMKIPSSSPAAASWGSLRRSKSASEYEYGGGINNSIRKWWDWGWAWILSGKPTFARDLEMNEAETAALGCHNKGSWRHVFYKVKSELGKFVGGWGSSDNVGLPQTFRPQL